MAVAWRAVPVALLLLTVTACGRGHEGENRSIVTELPLLDGTRLVDEEYLGYCSADSCPFGNDRSSALLTYSIDTDRWTQFDLAAAYQDRLTEWSVDLEDACQDAEPTRCDETAVVTFVRDRALVTLAFDNWPDQQFEISVDSRGVD